MTLEISDIVHAWQARPQEQFALATLVRARGSSYRLPGARMLISRDGEAVGSISGGCLEEEVIARARAVLQAGRPSVMTFDTRRRFGCHGEIDIFVEQASPTFLCGLAQWHGSRRSGRVVTVFDCAHSQAGSRFISEDERAPANAFVQILEARIQLLVVGKGPDCLALARLAETLGWDLQRSDCAGELTGAYDQRTAALIKTHNFGRDFAALRFLLPLGLRYVGLIGPRQRREQLLGDLLDSGVRMTDSLFSPAGHDLGGDAPESIALAIVAEIHAVFAGRSGNHLRDQPSSIHPAHRDGVQDRGASSVLLAGG